MSEREKWLVGCVVWLRVNGMCVKVKVRMRASATKGEGSSGAARANGERAAKMDVVKDVEEDVLNN